jgi:AraC-like DNA-binding protein
VWGESLLVEEISQWEECLRRARAIEREVRKARRRIERCPNLRKAHRGVEGCFGTTISVRLGAEYASLSKTAFEQRFAKVVGLSFHRYLVLDGLSRAIGRLESGDDPVTSVALEAGFTLGSLEYNFRRHLACCSPSAYRKAHRSQPRRGAIVGRIEPRVAAGRSNRAARTAAEDASRAAIAVPGYGELASRVCRLCLEFHRSSTCPSHICVVRAALPAGGVKPSAIHPAAGPAAPCEPRSVESIEAILFGGPVAETARRLRVDPRLEALWRLIESEHAACGLTLARASRGSGMSPARLNARLNEAVGVSFHRLLVRYRMLRAVALIRRDGSSLVEVAERAGFNHVSSLIRHFKKLVGTTPGAFRSFPGRIR